MTCIVGFIDKQTNKVFMGADSAGVAGFEIILRKDPKVFKNGEFLIGCTTSFRMIQLLRFSLKAPIINDKDIFEYLCTDFIDAIRKCFVDGGFMQKSKDGDEQGGAFLIAYKNRLFEIDSDYQVAESMNGILSCGCGSSYALGALLSIQNNDIPTNEKVLTALKAAAFYSAGVSEPFIIHNT